MLISAINLEVIYCAGVPLNANLGIFGEKLLYKQGQEMYGHRENDIKDSNLRAEKYNIV